MTITLSTEQVLQYLDEAVEEKGEYYIAEPQYVLGDDVCCIGGWVMHRAGVPLSELMRWDAQGYSNLQALADAGDLGDVTVENQGWSMLAHAQRQQDKGRHWGVVVENVKDNFVIEGTV